MRCECEPELIRARVSATTPLSHRQVEWFTPGAVTVSNTFVRTLHAPALHVSYGSVGKSALNVS